MRKVFLALAAATLLSGHAVADDVKIGIILGFTGPIESLTPAMAAGAELAISEVNDSGSFMGGSKIGVVRGDSTCIDSAAAPAAAERLTARSCQTSTRNRKTSPPNKVKMPSPLPLRNSTRAHRREIHPAPVDPAADHHRNNRRRSRSWKPARRSQDSRP